MQRLGTGHFTNPLTRRRGRPRYVFVLIALAALPFVPATSRAQYLDPGAASIVIQAVIAGVVAVGAGVKLYWSKIAGLFSRRRRPDRQA
jgi:hypothetical protein